MKKLKNQAPLQIVLAIALLAITPLSQATIFYYHVTLDGPSESPPNTSSGTGSGEVDYDNFAHTLHVQVTWSGLMGTTTASHIHAPTASPGTGTAGVATTTPYFAGFPTGVTSGSYDNYLDLTMSSSYNPAYISANGGTTASAEAALAAAMAAGEAYLNIHTTFKPGGEIRGFLVPEPSSMALLGIGGAVLGWVARRRKVS
jgi:hypothetical protein